MKIHLLAALGLMVAGFAASLPPIPISSAPGPASASASPQTRTATPRAR